jgi:methylphosphotriester-DNA--protein-cysteine methyltransferase
MKRFLAVTIFLLLFIPSALSVEFWASKKSNKYHYPDCRWAQKIKPENLIKFKSPEEAQQAGYIPCKVCRPPISSKSELNTDVKPVLIHFQTNDSEERRGCCSWHGGVCGCDSSTCRVICCDGILSPTCTCC